MVTGRRSAIVQGHRQIRAYEILVGCQQPVRFFGIGNGGQTRSQIFDGRTFFPDFPFVPLAHALEHELRLAGARNGRVRCGGHFAVNAQARPIAFQFGIPHHVLADFQNGGTGEELLDGFALRRFLGRLIAPQRHHRFHVPGGIGPLKLLRQQTE